MDGSFEHWPMLCNEAVPGSFLFRLAARMHIRFSEIRDATTGRH
jgi:hypothetical protein